MLEMIYMIVAITAAVGAMLVGISPFYKDKERARSIRAYGIAALIAALIVWLLL